MYRYCTIFLFTTLLLISCGTNLKTKMENMQPELDTAFYNKYIQKGPDNNIYPIFVHASSQRDPSEKFGLPCMMDGKMDTWWSAGFGLNSGEYVSMEFKDLKASTCKIFIANNNVMAKVFTVLVYANDSLIGNFPSGTPINLPKGLKKLKIVAGGTDGLNEVKLPVENDSTGKIQITKRNIITRYNSKSFGIAEIEFYDDKNQKLPVRSIPFRRAIVQGAYNFVDERFYCFDGDPATSMQWIKQDGTGKFVITFPDFTPCTKLKFYVGSTDYLFYPLVAEVGWQIGGKKEQKYTLKPGLNEIEMTEPFVARTYTLTIYKFEKGYPTGAINEIQCFDGARWYNIEPDSMYVRADRLRDSLANTPIKNILNGEISYVNEYTLLNTDTVIIKNSNDIPQSLVDKRISEKTTVLIRSNYTWEASTSVTTITYGKKVSLVVTTKTMFGDYKVISKSPEQVVLRNRYKLTEQTSVDGKPGKPNVKLLASNMTITKTNLILEDVFDMMISY
jgi:hypothetical protein